MNYKDYINDVLNEIWSLATEITTKREFDYTLYDNNIETVYR